MDETMASPGAWNTMLGGAADWNNRHRQNNTNNNHRRAGGEQPLPHDTAAVSGRVSRLYAWLSLGCALLAICTTSPTATSWATPARPPSVLSRAWTATTTAAAETADWKNKNPVPAKSTDDNNNNGDASSPLPIWLRWVLPLKQQQQGDNNNNHENDNNNDGASTNRAACTADQGSTTHYTLAASFASFSFSWSSAGKYLQSLIDPTLMQPSSHTLPDLIDKVLTSTPRLLAMANFLLSLTYLLHTAVADWFLGRPWAMRPEWQHREKLGGFLVFKLLLISAVVAPDTLDLLILLSWYTLLSFLRSLAHLCAAAIQHCTAAGQAPPTGVLQLLTIVWMSNIMAAAVCVALFHAAGAGMVWLLTCDCALLAVDVFGHVLQHLAAVWEVTHATQLSALEEQEEARLGRMARAVAVPPLDREQQQQHSSSSEDNSLQQQQQQQHPATTPNQDRIQRLEESHSRRMQLLDTTIFAAQLLSHILTVAHFLHIWSLHGLQLTLIDGVLALHLHSAVSSASRQITQRRNLHRIARHLDDVFEDATELELRKHTTDVCCVCLCGLSSHVKKVACGHLYHAHCLREVVERARSMESAKCPLCRASVLDGGRPGGFSNSSNNNIAARAAVVNIEDVAREDPAADVQQQGPQVRQAPLQPQQQQQQQQQQDQQQQALFRFSTDAILPAWVPIPNFSFEIVRRPATPPPPIQPPAAAAVEADAAAGGNPDTSWMRRLLLLTGAVPMTPAEEAVAIEQLVDMFPQYDRSDLLRELRQRGSLEGVAEAVLTGVFTGIPR